MANYKTIYECRCNLTNKRQPTHMKACEKLHNYMKDFNPPMEHPYSLGRLYIKFIEHPYLKSGAQGIVADLTTIEYVYRIMSLSKLVRDTSGWSYLPVDVIDLKALERIEIAKLRFELNRFRENRDDWLRLAEFATGELATVRGFTW